MRNKFTQFVAANNKNYRNSQEYELGYQNFARNSDMIDSFNTKNSTTKGFLLGVNSLADLSESDIEDLI